MRNIKFLMLLAFSFVLLQSCSDDDNNDNNNKIPPVVNSSMKLVQSINENNHVIEFYSTHENFILGYNPIEIKIKDASTQEYYSDIEVSKFIPSLSATIQNSCPRSEIFEKKEGVASGFAVFNMISFSSLSWRLNFDYTINGKTYKIADKKTTVNFLSERQNNYAIGFGSNEKKYIVTYTTPQNPKTGTNNITAKVFTTEDNLSFTEVKNFKILLDPRMPSMGNHSSPNNTPLTYNASTGLYEGKVNFSMPGYWKLNLQLVNENGEVILGNEVTNEKESSNLYWQVEF